MNDNSLWTQNDHDRLLRLSIVFQTRLHQEFPGRGLQAFVALTLATAGELMRQAEDPDDFACSLNEQLSDTPFRVVRIA